jgi:eukaryotic-like serine/threonine-protein kinase
VPASGGKAVPVTTLDHAQHSTHRWPQFLPDGKHFLYLAAHPLSGNAGIYAGSIDGGSPKFIVRTNGSVLLFSAQTRDQRFVRVKEE